MSKPIISFEDKIFIEEAFEAIIARIMKGLAANDPALAKIYDGVSDSTRKGGCLAAALYEYLGEEESVAFHKTCLELNKLYHLIHKKNG